MRIFYKHMMRAAVLAIGLASMAGAQSKVGTSAAVFLGMPVSPRGIAIGGANVATSYDASSLYYNPGAFSRMEMSQVLVSRTNWLVDTKLNWAGVVLNLDGTNALGVSYTQLDYGEDAVTTDLQQNGTGELWSASDLAIGISYSRNLTDRFSIGGTAKYIQQRIWNSTASSFGIDVGLLYITDFNGLKIGMSISNFGGDMRMDGKDLYHQIDIDPSASGTNKTLVALLKADSWPLPLLFRAGISMDAVKTQSIRLTLMADALRPSDNAESVNLGGEFSYNETLFLRGGRRALGLPDALETYSFGVGARYELNATSAVSFDYSYQKMRVFDGVQSLALGITF
ncbi:MAG: PorV/PorQ family protein [Acidobacteriota bacterium]